MRRIILKNLCCFVVSFCCCNMIYGQSKQFDPKDLSITFTGVTNDYQNTNQALLGFDLSNKGKKVLPATGWKIYFNSKSDLKNFSDKDELQIERKKGNLFCFFPTEGFKGLSVKGKYQAQLLLDDGLISKSDQPEGFYIVWDNEPAKGYDIKNVTFTRMFLQEVDGRLQSNYAEVVYKRNAATDRTVDPRLCPIFPTPKNYVAQDGYFTLDQNNITINADDAFAKEAALFSSDLKAIGNIKSTIVATNGNAKIQFRKKEGLGEEGYELNITAQDIVINATSPAGIFYAIQSLKGLLLNISRANVFNGIRMPLLQINDAPRFGYRGLMIDVARDFQTKEEVKRILDLMAIFKLNTFHFHITDDEGWRLEIDGLPELTSFGANRGHSLDESNYLPSAYGSGADTGKLYGSGFYSKRDFIEILQYANDRHITVIPEIETPGHARAAIKAMDFRYRKFMAEGNREAALQYFLRDTMDASVYNTPQAFHDNVMNVALPSCYTFIAKVVTEIDRLYKDAGLEATSIHFGGDEVPAGTWERSPACDALIAADPELNNTNDLWYYYLGKIDSILKIKNITLSGWEEIGLRKTMIDGKNIMIPNPGFTNRDMCLYVWNNIGGNEDLAYKLANAGYKVVLAPVTNFYLDMIQYKTYDEPGYYWGGVTDITKTYQYIPFDFTKNLTEDNEGNAVDPSSFTHKQRLTDYGKNNVLGLEAALWGETIKGPQQLEYMLLPRLAALAERAWQQDPAWATATDTAAMRNSYVKAWSSFAQVTGTRLFPLLDHYNGGYNYRIPPAGAIVQNNAVLANIQFPGLDIRYTVNSAEPTIESKLYSGPINEKGIIRLKVFNTQGRSSYTTVIENK